MKIKGLPGFDSDYGWFVSITRIEKWIKNTAVKRFGR